MNLLNQVSIRSRIIVLVLLPIVIVALFSIERYRLAARDQAVISDLRLLMALSNAAGSLMVELQEERDLSSGFTSKKLKDLDDNPYREPLLRQREPVDIQLAEFRSYVAMNKHRLASMGDLSRILVKVEESLNLMLEMRPRIDAGITLTDEGIYTVSTILHTIQNILKLFNEIILASASNRELALLTNTYVNLVKLGEQYSLERGIAIRLINQTGRMLEVRARIADKEIANAIDGFNVYASRELREYFKAYHLDTPERNKVHEVRKLLRKNRDKLFEYDEAVWYEESTANFNSLSKVQEYVARQIEQKSDELYSDATFKVRQSIAVLIVVVIVVGLISFVIIQSIIGPLKNLIRELSYIAENKDVGYLVKVNGRDELAEAAGMLQNLLGSFNDALGGVRQVESQMNGLTSRVLESMTVSQQRAESQNRSTDSVSVAMNEMAASIKEVSNTAHTTSDVVQTLYSTSVKSSDGAITSKNIVEQLINELGEAVSLVQSLKEESVSIGDVLSVIQGIAEQTNLLALNAAIEAARAGEQGRGFSVVADEVRSLASRTQESTKHIRQQIESLQKGADTVSLSMGQLKGQGEKAISVVIESLGAFDTLRKELDSVSNMSTQIATAAEQQTQVANEINEQIHAIKQDAEEMTAHAETTLSASNELDQTAQTLNSYVIKFNVV